LKRPGEKLGATPRDATYTGTPLQKEPIRTAVTGAGRGKEETLGRERRVNK